MKVTALTSGARCFDYDGKIEVDSPLAVNRSATYKRALKCATKTFEPWQN